MTMEAHGDAQTRGHVGEREHSEVVPVEHRVPELPPGHADRDEGKERDQRRYGPVERLVADRLHLGDRWPAGGRCGEGGASLLDLFPPVPSAISGRGSARTGRRLGWLTVAARGKLGTSRSPGPKLCAGN